MAGTAVVRDGDRLYRRFRFGTLAELSMLDLRSYRSKQVSQADIEAIDDPARTITGDDQMGWLKRGLAQSPAQWKLVGNPVMITPVQFPPVPADVRRALEQVGSFAKAEGSRTTSSMDGYPPSAVSCSSPGGARGHRRSS